MKKYLCLGLLALTFCLGGCSSKTAMKDGFYTAEMSGYSHGWKEYLCIMVIWRTWLLFPVHILTLTPGIM